MMKIIAFAALVATANGEAHAGAAGVLEAYMGPYPGCVEQCVTDGTVQATFDGKELAATYAMMGVSGITPSLKANAFSALSAYAGANFGTDGIEAAGATGVVVEHNAGDTIMFHYDFTMSEMNATGGVHIHAGNSCDEPGPHYWNSNKSAADPWGAATKWSSDTNGKASGSFPVGDTYGYGANNGKVVVVHDSSGAKMACAVLEAATGGVHVHAGTSCEDAAKVGGHYWDSKNGTVADGWKGAKYDTTAVFETAPSTVVKTTVIVDDGYDLAAHVGHAVVVHSAMGTKIGCGVLVVPAGPTAAANTTAAPAVVTQAATTVNPAVAEFMKDMAAACGNATKARRESHAGKSCNQMKAMKEMMMIKQAMAGKGCSEAAANATRARRAGHMNVDCAALKKMMGVEEAKAADPTTAAPAATTAAAGEAAGEADDAATTAAPDSSASQVAAGAAAIAAVVAAQLF